MNPDRENELVIPYAAPPPAPPMWVRLALWGIRWRWLAWVFVWLSVAPAVVCFVLGFRHPLWFIGTAMLVAAFWYWASIRWVDRHGGWSQVKG